MSKGSNLKLTKSRSAPATTEDVAGPRSAKSNASSKWATLMPRAKGAAKSLKKAAAGQKRKPESDNDKSAPVKKAKESGVALKGAGRTGRRYVPLDFVSSSEEELPASVTASMKAVRPKSSAPAPKGKGKSKPMSESSSGEEDEDFQPSEDNSGEDYSSNDDADILDDDIAGLQQERRKAAREQAKKKAFKKAVVDGTFEATWRDDERDNASEPVGSSAAAEQPDTIELSSDSDQEKYALPLSHSVPAGVAAAAAAAPPRNIELVLPLPGRRFLSLRAQPSVLQELFELTMEQLSWKLHGFDHFPDRRARADMKLSATFCAIRLANGAYADVEARLWNGTDYSNTFTSLLEPRIPLLRSAVHDLSDGIVLDEYDLPSRPADRARAIFDLMAACTFLYPLNHQRRPDRSQPFRHPAILSVFKAKFLSGSPNFLERHSRNLEIAQSEDDPTPVRAPAPMIAFVAVCVLASLMDWKTGHHVSVDFSRDNFNHPYRQYLKRLDSLREKFGADVYHQYLSDFYEAASAFNNDDDDGSFEDGDWDVDLVAAPYLAVQEEEGDGNAEAPADVAEE